LVGKIARKSYDTSCGSLLCTVVFLLTNFEFIMCLMKHLITNIVLPWDTYYKEKMEDGDLTNIKTFSQFIIVIGNIERFACETVLLHWLEYYFVLYMFKKNNIITTYLNLWKKKNPCTIKWCKLPDTLEPFMYINWLLSENIQNALGFSSWVSIPRFIFNKKKNQMSHGKILDIEFLLYVGWLLDEFGYIIQWSKMQGHQKFRPWAEWKLVFSKPTILNACSQSSTIFSSFLTHLKLYLDQQ